MKKKKYVTPSTKVLVMEVEPIMATSLIPGDDPVVPIHGGMPGEDGTDLEKGENASGAKSYSVWD